MRYALLVVVVALVACGGESSLPPASDAGADAPAADAPTSGPYAGHPLVGTWEAPEPGMAGGAVRRTFGADGSFSLYGYFGIRSMPGCNAVTRANGGMWMPAGDGVITGSVVTASLSQDCNGVMGPVTRMLPARELEGRHTFTITNGELRFDPEAGPGYVYRRVQP